MRHPSTPQPQQKRTLATGQGLGADQAAGAEERLVSINASSVWLWRGWVEKKNSILGCRREQKPGADFHNLRTTLQLMDSKK